ncbi:hypothetical protein ACQYWQ_12090 [Streptomyces sp. P6-2-1]|uniref:hypothetical protein n=1 Tax=unclassified Streptomyces TaxID=2593676 RepID=UPI003D3649BA
MSDHSNPRDHNDPDGTAQPANLEDIKAVERLERESATASRLFDVRLIIGGLFTVYGIIVTISGITASDADIDKAQNININLWTGLGMLVLGLLFLAWMLWRPQTPPPVEDIVEDLHRNE